MARPPLLRLLVFPPWLGQVEVVISFSLALLGRVVFRFSLASKALPPRTLVLTEGGGRCEKHGLSSHALLLACLFLCWFLCLLHSPASDAGSSYRVSLSAKGVHGGLLRDAAIELIQLPSCLCVCPVGLIELPSLVIALRSQERT